MLKIKEAVNLIYAECAFFLVWAVGRSNRRIEVNKETTWLQNYCQTSIAEIRIFLTGIFIVRKFLKD